MVATKTRQKSETTLRIEAFRKLERLRDKWRRSAAAFGSACERSKQRQAVLEEEIAEAAAEYDRLSIAESNPTGAHEEESE